MKNAPRLRMLLQFVLFVGSLVVLLMYWHKWVTYSLEYLHNSLMLSYGLSIIAITFIVKALIAVFTINDNVNSKKKVLVSKELKELHKQISSDLNQADWMQQRKEATKSVYRRYNIDRFRIGVIVWMVIQTIILIGFIRVFRNYEGLEESQFLWLNLSNNDPYFILPILVMVITLINCLLLNNFGKKMRIFYIILSLLIGGIITFTPASIGIYILTNASVALLQTIITLNLARKDLFRVKNSKIKYVA